jgi:hypothetical protein
LDSYISNYKIIYFLSQQYILSGSDDFNLYMWRIPADPEAGEYVPGETHCCG